MALSGFPYHGHYIRLDPEQNKEQWEALEASRKFGRRMVENFTVPAYGEGIYIEPA